MAIQVANQYKLTMQSTLDTLDNCVKKAMKHISVEPLRKQYGTWTCRMLTDVEKKKKQNSALLSAWCAPVLSAMQAQRRHHISLT